MSKIEEDFQAEQLIRFGFAKIEKSVENDIHIEWYRELLNWVIAEKLDTIENMALGMMEDSIKNGVMKSMDLISHGIYITISTIPCSSKNARQRFYPDGYFKFVNYLISIAWNIYSTSHFMHIQFFKNDDSFEIMITLLPNRNLINFSPVYIFPGELLRNKKIKLMHKKNLPVFYEESFIHKMGSLKFWINNFKNLLLWFKTLTIK